MIKRLLFIILCCSAWGAQAQYFYWDEGLLGNDSATHQLKVTAGQYINSNTIDNQMIDALFAGEVLTDEVKSNTLSRLKENNRLGSDTKLNLAYMHQGEKLNWGLKFNTRDYLNANITNDAVALLLLGNTYNMDEELDLSGLNVQYFSYNQCGVLLEKALCEKLTVGGQVSYLSVHKAITLQLDDSYIATYEGGKTIDTQLKGSMTNIQAEGNRISPANNMGAALDVYALYNAREAKVYFSANNIGFISAKGGKGYVVDTAFTYNGIALSADLQMDSLFGANDMVLSDTLVKLPGVEVKDIVGSLMLPMEVKLGYQMQLMEVLYATAQLKHVFNANYSPKISLALSKQFSFPLTTDLLLAYGGYSKFDVGLGLSYTLANRLTAFYKTFYLEDLIAPSSSTGQGNSFGVVFRVD